MKGEIIISENRKEKSMSEERRQHLEFIQNNITRMNQSSFQIKGMAVTIATALLAAYVAVPVREGICSTIFLFIAIIPTFVFWLLDSYYLLQEKRFRALYNDIISGKKEIVPYAMPLDDYKGKDCRLIKCMWTITEWPLYFIGVIGLTIIGFVLM